MRVLLIDPPFKYFTGFVNYYYPIGLAYLAASLREARHQTAILDVDALNKGSDIDFTSEYTRLELYRQGINNNEHDVWRDIENISAQYNPDITGITVMTTKFGSALKTAEIIKKRHPHMLIIAGGPHATLQPEQILKSSHIDIILRGEGEITFTELVAVLENHIKNSLYRGINYPIKLQNIEALRNIKGISFRSDSGVIHNPDREFIQDIDSIGFPDRNSLMYPENYTPEDMGALMASRGCPFDCAYCCHPWGRRVRHRSIDNVILEMKEVAKTYNTKQFEFKDDSFTVNRKWTIEFCSRLVSERLNVSWSCTTRADILDDEMIRKMKNAGCNTIKIGIETGSEKILEQTNKGESFRQIKDTANLLNKHGIFWSGYFMIGLPTETREDILMTCNFMKEINPYYAGLGVYNPFPDTQLFNLGVEMGLLRPEVELDHFFKTNPKDYYYINPDNRVQNMNKRSFDELLSYVMKFFHKHNIKYTNLMRRALARRKVYYKDYRMLAGDIKKAIKWIS